MSYLHEWHMQRHNFLSPRPQGPWGGAKRSNIIKSQLLSQFQRFFKPNSVRLLTNERYKTNQTGLSFARLGHARGVGIWGTVEGLGVDFFSEIQPKLVCELLI